MNRRLVGGLALLAALVGLSALGPLLYPYPPNYAENLRVVEEGGVKNVIFAPEAPGPRHLLGTDRYGYDMVTNLLRGLPWTLATVFGVALLRSSLAFVGGVGTALGRWKAGKPRSFSPLAALPSFIIAYFVLYPLTINPALAPLLLLAIQVAVIALLELPALARSFSSKGETIASRAFVEAARSCGAGETWIAFRHIAPLLVDDLIESIPRQAVAAAAFVARLGIFSLFMGGTTLQYDPYPSATVLFSMSQELVGLMGHHYLAFPEHWWLFLGPFVGWLLVLLSAELCASGLRLWKDERERIIGSVEEG
ncbi:MAG TPA: ABC transporter permease subunit [Rectinemataceae bacterium]|nr:ABC transporter permease subunit [Rectinemataceae bacterium]